MSDLFPSLRTKDPSVVQAGLTASAALSAEMLAPPVAAVIETLAAALPATSRKQATTQATNAGSCHGPRRRDKKHEAKQPGNWRGTRLLAPTTSGLIPVRLASKLR